MAEFIIASDRPLESYEEFIQEGMKAMSEYEIIGCAMIGMIADGKIICGYHNMSVDDKERAGAAILSDAMLETVRNNLADMLEELEEDDDEE